MRLGTAIERLVDNYRYASDKEWIQDKVAWALYYTWKEADDRKTEQTDCPTCKWWSGYGYCVHRECKGYEPQERSE